jgi:hypothetical protein
MLSEVYDLHHNNTYILEQLEALRQKRIAFDKDIEKQRNHLLRCLVKVKKAAYTYRTASKKGEQDGQ